MPIEQKTGHVFDNYLLPVVRYHDAQDQPTCAADFSDGKVCVFYATQRKGWHETCCFARVSSGSRYAEPLKRRRGGEGSLVPTARCPLWKQPPESESR